MIEIDAMASEDTATHDLFGPRRAQPGAARAGLVLLWAPDARVPEVVSLGDGPFVMGREPPPGGLAIPHAGVSRLHARIHRAGEAWLLSDLDSRNGTLVDGVRVRTLALQDGDEIRVGDTIWKFVERVEPYAAAGPAPDPSVLVGGAQMRRILAELAAIARSELPVLVLGETGTGKEVVARAVHAASGRPGAIAAINCAAIPTTLLESELFGYKRGAFTGADRDKRGLVASAHRGTLFLDEIGDMPLEAQAKLLRLLETREVLPLGGRVAEHVDVRVVAATHRDLSELVASNKFRGDLYARLAGHVTRLPPLRARKEDLRLLVDHFVRRDRRGAQTSPTFMASLIHYDWPYNVRELEAAIRRALALLEAEGGAPVLEARHLPDAIARCMESYGTEATAGSLPPPPATAQALARDRAPAADLLRDLLVRHRGNVAAIAREMRKDRVQIHRWMKRHGLRPDDFR